MATSSALQQSELGQFIPTHYHYQMLLDQARILGFQQAIDATVTEGSKVLELGGGTGVLSYYASKKAAKVSCIEFNPALVEKSKQFLKNNGANNVEVIQGDASEFVPSEPVDFVICEMLHAAMLREQQIAVLEKFKANYLKKFEKLPQFIPASTLLAVQPVNQVFSFNGYKAEIPLFFPAGMENTATTGIVDPFSYSIFHYHQPLPQHFACGQEFEALVDGEINALRFITKNILAYLVDKNTSIDWYNLYMILPLAEPVSLKKGEPFKISFSYAAGASLEELSASISVKKI